LPAELTISLWAASVKPECDIFPAETSVSIVAMRYRVISVPARTNRSLHVSGAGVSK